MLYKKNSEKKLDKKLFENPTSEYRGAPFWSWNCKLNKEMLTEQIEYLKEMGFGGFHMHSRSGMATEYLSEEFFDLVKACVQKAKDENMLAWLYDEDRWPSGTAGGYVTRTKKFREKYLLFTRDKETGEVSGYPEGIEDGITSFLACYDVVLNENGELLSGKRIGIDDNAEGTKWYAYIKNYEECGWHNGQTYVDALSKEAIDEFIRITHEGYKKHVGEDFGERVPAIFTDEPRFSCKVGFDHACCEDGESARFPWTIGLEYEYKKRYGLDLLENLPEIFWELPCEKTSPIRYYYHDLVSALFVENYMDNCGDWCAENGIKFTGHVLGEESIPGQVHRVGDAMRCYRKMGIPGIDMLLDGTEFSTAKQAQSVVHQYGKEGMLSELYGVTNWDFDFRGHKFQGDWQAALGVTVRVPHLSWVSMKGSAKRDYPASINYQSPWYKEYPLVENHFARLNTALTRGKPVVNVGIISPVESSWLRYGPIDATGDIQISIENDYQNLIQWLLFGTIDFDLIDEALLSEAGSCTSCKLTMGQMDYPTVIVPASCETLRRSTLNLLKKFKENGGRLIFLGKCPKYIEGRETNEIEELFNLSEHVNNDKISIMNALKPERIISVTDGQRGLSSVVDLGWSKDSEKLIYQLREDGDCNWLFLAHGKNFRKTSGNQQITHADVPMQEHVKIVIKGEFIPELYDTQDGSVTALDCTYENGNTIIRKCIYCCDSLLIRLEKGKKESVPKEKCAERAYKKIDFKKPVSYSLCEDNVYLLDMAEYSLDGGEFMPLEEVLRIDEKCRKPLNFPKANGTDCQPWCIDEEKPEHSITLKFEIESDIDAENIRIAAEEAQRIVFNGEEISTEPTGYYVDKSIHTYRLPNISKGKNTLLITVPFGKRISVEACYLLGKFGVSVIGANKRIVSLPETLAFGSYAAQGLPFYGGNVIYNTEFELEEDAEIEICAQRYRGSLIKVIIDGKDIGRIIYPPYKLNPGKLSKGKHSLQLVLFGNRANTFGSLHNYSNSIWYGPDYWYAQDEKGWSYEYNLKETGILSSPVIKCFK